MKLTTVDVIMMNKDYKKQDNANDKAESAALLRKKTAQEWANNSALFGDGGALDMFSPPANMPKKSKKS